MKIGYIGNSYFTSNRLGEGRHLGDVLEDMAAAAGIDLEVTLNWQLTQRQHWNDTEGTNAQDMLTSGEYDITVHYPHGWNLIGRQHDGSRQGVTHRSGVTQEEGLAEFNEYVDLMAGLAAENNVSIMIPSMWAIDTFLEGEEDEWYAPLSHQEMRETALRLGAAYSATGPAMAEAYRLISLEAGDDGTTAENLLTRDNVHLGDHGTYLVAVMHYHSFFGEMPPPPSVYTQPRLTVEEAQFYYDLAADIIEEYSFFPFAGNANEGSRLDLTADAIEVEAEDMLATGMTEVNGQHSSGGSHMVVDGATGSLETTFTGANGLYRISLMIEDDPAADASADLLVNGQLVHTYELTRPWDQLGNDTNFGVFRVYDIDLDTGDTVRIDVAGNSPDIGRVDKLVFEPLTFAEGVEQSGSVSGTLTYAGNSAGAPALDTYSVVLFNVAEGTVTSGAVAADGSYSFDGLDAGLYQMRFLPQDGVDFIDADEATNFGVESDITGSWPTGIHFTGQFLVEPFQDVTGIDAGLNYGNQPPVGAAITGQLAYAGDPVNAPDLDGVTIVLFNADAGTVTSGTANADGSFQFYGLDAGTYQLRIPPIEGVEVLNVADAAFYGAESDFTGSWANGVTFTSQITLAANQIVDDIDAALKYGDIILPDKASISGSLAYAGDPNNPPSFDQFAVVLFNADTARITEGSVAADGSYSFSGLDAGTYQIRFRPVDEVEFLTTAEAAAFGEDSDITGGWGNGVRFTGQFSVADGEAITGIDASLKFGEIIIDEGASVAGSIVNLGNLPGGPDLSDFEVILFDVDERTIDVTSTDANGDFIFSGLDAGDFQLRFRPIDGATYLDAATAPDYGGVSDITGGWGNGVVFTDVFSVATDQDITGLDAAFIDEGYAPGQDQLVLQSGELTFFQDNVGQWHSHSFAQAMDNPIVVAGALTFNGGDPAHMRIRNVTETGFEYQMEEWDYDDGGHATETTWWVAVEAGVHTTSDGATIEAGRAIIEDSWTDIALTGDFGDNSPVVFGTVSSENDVSPVTDRMTDVSQTGFSAHLEEEEAADRVHADESYDWIALERGDFFEFSAGVTGQIGDQNVKSFEVGVDIGADDALLVDMYTTRGGDAASVRITGTDGATVSAFVQEEQSADDEVTHADENLAWAVFTGDVIV